MRECVLCVSECVGVFFVLLLLLLLVVVVVACLMVHTHTHTNSLSLSLFCSVLFCLKGWGDSIAWRTLEAGTLEAAET